jgi:hypothetical protein
VDVNAVPRLPFKHNRIFEMVVKRLRDKCSYSTRRRYLLPEQFTFTQVHETYEHVMGIALDKCAFRRKLTEMDVLEECKGQRVRGAHRPAQLFKENDIANRLRLLDRPLAVRSAGLPRPRGRTLNPYHRLGVEQTPQHLAAVILRPMFLKQPIKTIDRETG